MWSLRVLLFTVFAAAVATGLLHANNPQQPRTAVVSYAETMWPANCRDSISYGGSPRPKSTKRPASASSYIGLERASKYMMASMPSLSMHNNESSVIGSARSIGDASIAYILSSINTTLIQQVITIDASQALEQEAPPLMSRLTLKTKGSDGVYRMTPGTRIKSTLAALFGVFLVFAIKM